MGKFALLIGVSDYAEGLSALPAATQDIAAFQQVLEAPNLGAFDEVRLLPNPTRDDMASTVELWLAARQPEDLVLLFFSGHGLKDDRRELYFATGNTRKVDNQLVRSTAVAARTLHDFLRYSRPRQQVMILDCCFSGAFGDFIARDDGDIALQEQLAAEGRVVLTSTSAVDYAFEEKESELSVYTRYLVEGIEKGTADLNGDGFITVDELHAFASRKVKEAAPAMSPDIITLQGQGYSIRLASAPQDKPELKYRKEVEKRARKGKFTIPAKRMLRSLRQRYGLSDELAETIEAEVLKPFRDYQRKLSEYHDVLAECLKARLTLDRDHLIDLKDYQKYLGLEDKDVRPIEQALAGQALSLEVPAQTVPAQPSKQADVWPVPKSPSPTFSFETVRVNEQGGVIETIPGKAEYLTEDLGSGVTLDMVRIPGGTFLMGAAEGEAGASKDEYPQHEVKVPEFWMGKYAVTQEQWAAVAALKKVERDLEKDPANFKGAKRPVEQVFWKEAMEFCKRLSQNSERRYRLPSEAQWEYACRAGTTTPFHFGATLTSDIANFCANSSHSTYASEPKGKYRQKTTNVGIFPPNAFGIYDMHGNVSEWCLDYLHNIPAGNLSKGSVQLQLPTGEDILLSGRGGSWRNIPHNCCCTSRKSYQNGSYDFSTIGFRVACAFPQ